MSNVVLFLLFAWAFVPGTPARAADADPFPRPAAIEPQVQFWTRIYSEVDTKGGLLHDSRLMGVVYEEVRFKSGAGRRSRDRQVKARRAHYKKILGTLSSGKRSGLSTEQKRVLALFPDGVSNKTLRGARERIRFQLGQSNRFRAGLIRAGRWEPHIASALADHGVPYELSALPHVESSYNPAAHSHAGAAGLWQFTRSTGRMFMRIDHVVDQRMDPYVASVAAARLLLANHRRTKTWPTAITAYNHGTAGMEKAIRKLGTRDIARIIADYRSRTFGFASRNFYTSFLAAVEVSRNAEHYFGPLVVDPAEDLELVTTDHYYAAATLARVFGVGEKTLRKYNGSLLSPVWGGQKYVPKGTVMRFPRRASGPEPELVLAQIPASETILRQRPDRGYRVRRGDTLSGIARRFGVKMSDLVALNGLRSRNQIRIGQKLKLPTHDGPTTVAMVRDHDHNARKKLDRPADGVYRVHRGDTLSGIAGTFGVTVGELLAANQLRNRNQLRIGQPIFIPGPAKGVATTYVVQRGDSLEQIAKRHGVSARALQNANHIRNRNRIHPGQVLAIPGTAGAVAAVEPAPPSRYTVRRGDTLAGIARRHGVSLATLQSENRLRNRNQIVVGQVLSIPGAGRTAPAAAPAPAEATPVETTVSVTLADAAEAPAPQPAAVSTSHAAAAATAALLEAASEAPAAPAAASASLPDAPIAVPGTPPADSLPSAPAAEAPIAEPPPAEPVAPPAAIAAIAAITADPAPPLAPDESASALPWAPDRYAVAADGSIVVHPEETLGHYADWLELRAQRLRQLNGLKYGRALSIGKRIRLDFSKVEHDRFEQRRLDHHRSLQTSFFDAFAVAGTNQHVLRRGETLWKLSRGKYDVPVWLIQQYNPGLDMNALRPGMRIEIPVVEPRAKREA